MQPARIQTENTNNHRLHMVSEDMYFTMSSIYFNDACKVLKCHGGGIARPRLTW